MKQTFSGYLTQYSGDSRDNVPVAKLSIKCKELSTVKAVLSPFQDADDSINGAYNFIQSNGYGNAKYKLDEPLKLYVTFAELQFEAHLVALSVKKKAESDGGDSVEYCFNLEKEPTEADVKLWVSYLKYKNTDEPEMEGDVTVADMLLDPLGEPLDGKKKKKKKPTLVEFDVTFDTEIPCMEDEGCGDT